MTPERGAAMVPLNDAERIAWSAYRRGLGNRSYEDVRPGIEAPLRDLAVALRVAGPDDAIVPLHALRVARNELAAIQESDTEWPAGQAALDALDAALGAALAAATPPEQHHDA